MLNLSLREQINLWKTLPKSGDANKELDSLIIALIARVDALELEVKELECELKEVGGWQ